MRGVLLLLLALVTRPWMACQTGLPDPDTKPTPTGNGTTVASTEVQPTPAPSVPIVAQATTTSVVSTTPTTTRSAPGGGPKYVRGADVPTVPLKSATMAAQNDVDKRRLGAFYRTVYTGNRTKGAPSRERARPTMGSAPLPPPSAPAPSSSSTAPSTPPTRQVNLTHIITGSSSSSSTTPHVRDLPATSSPSPPLSSTSPVSSSHYGNVERAPWRQGHTHHNTRRKGLPASGAAAASGETAATEKAGPYFRPPSAISHKYKNFRVDPGQPLEDIDPECWPHCRNGTRGSKRKRKHSANKKRKYYNYKLLYDTLKGDLRRQETEFYAWIFGATMLTLGSLTTLTSCFVFCFCSEKWRKRRQTRRYDKSGQYQRVDSVSSMVDSHLESQEHQEQMDSVTII